MRNLQGRVIVGLDAVTMELSDVAAFIWKAVNGQRTVAEIAAAVAGEYDVAVETTNEDVVEFLASMVEAGFVEVRSVPGANCGGAPNQPSTPANRRR